MKKAHQVICTDRLSIEAGLLVRSSYVVISICDSGCRPARIPNTSGLRGVLQVSFDDAEPAANLALPADVALMSREQARAIWDFVERSRDAAETFVVHCHQGMSRSPAVAAAIAEYLGLDARRFFAEYAPNQYVLTLMRESRPPSRQGGGITP